MGHDDDPTIIATQPEGTEPISEADETTISPGPRQTFAARGAGAYAYLLRRTQALFVRLKNRREHKKKPVDDDWREWSRFKVWRKTRPLVGSILIMLAGILVLWGPVALLPFALLPGSNIWAGLLVGGLLFIMGLIQLLVPSNTLVTGAIAVVLSIISLLVAVGGFGIGMILGIIGGAMGVAWQPASKARRRQANSRPRRKLPAFTRISLPRIH